MQQSLVDAGEFTMNVLLLWIRFCIIELYRLDGFMKEWNYMSKKIDLIEATSRVVEDKGISGLTLEAVAQEANVSKGGLLYHYATKDDLIEALNVHVIKNFRTLIDKHVALENSYHEAYLLATLDTLQENVMPFDITTSLLAAIAMNREVLDLWRAEYKYLHEQLSHEKYPPEYSLFVKSICDGLWFSKLFGFEHIDQNDEKRVIEYVLWLLKEGEL